MLLPLLTSVSGRSFLIGRSGGYNRSSSDSGEVLMFVVYVDGCRVLISAMVRVESEEKEEERKEESKKRS